jgi:serine phosphatase RsbU (regulator of sigma subunit)
VASSGDDVLRLAAVIDRQRRELDRLRAAGAARSVVDMAKGTLVERLGCSPAEAARQLETLAAESGTAVTEMAAAILDEQPLPSPGGGPPPPSPGGGPARTLLAEAAAELAEDGGELAAAVLDHALAPLGAAAVVLWLLSADGGLDLLGEAGLGPAEHSRWRRIPPQMDCPAQRVAHGGPDVWWPAGPDAGETVPLPGRWPGGARTVAALRYRGAALLGVMEICWPGPRAGFPDSIREQVAALAQACAQVVGARAGDLAPAHSRTAVNALLSGVLESVIIAPAVRDDAGNVTDFRIDQVSDTFRDPAGRNAAELTGRTLLEAYPTAATHGGLLDRAAEVLTTGQPQHVPGPVATAPAGIMAGGVGDIRIARYLDGVVIAWRPAGQADRLSALLGHVQRLGRIGGWDENLLTGEAEWTDSALGLFGLPARSGAAIALADLHSYVIAADAEVVKRFRDALLRGKEPSGATFRIVRADDGSVRQIRVFAEPVIDPAGQVITVRGAFQDVSAEYHTQVALAATRDQLADSEQRADEEHLLAVRLQQAIMPPDEQPVEAAGIDVAVRYRPAAPGHLVGGDWYDTLLLPTKKVLVVVGDIAGHGIEAVTGVVAARYSLRGLAITGAGPAELIALLNSAICNLTAGVVGTVVCGLYDPSSRLLRWARAGHLPPVVARGETATPLPLPHGVLLGTDPDASYEEFTVPLQAGDTVLLFTDGLIERREIPIDEALEAFASRAARPPGPAGGPQASAAEYADRILANVASDTGDDACLVAVRIH